MITAREHYIPNGSFTSHKGLLSESTVRYGLQFPSLHTKGRAFYWTVIIKIWLVKFIRQITLKTRVHEPKLGLYYSKNKKAIAQLIKVRVFLILWSEMREPDVCFNPPIVNNGSGCISPRISDQSSSIHSNSLHNDNSWNNWTAWKFYLSTTFLIWSKVTGQHDQQDERLTGKLPNQSRHCPLTGRYFEPCILLT